jgi:phage protein D
MSAPVAPVTYSILVNGVQVTNNPLDVELRQAFGKQELFFARIEYNRLYPSLSSVPIWANDAPVVIRWGRGVANLNTWYGYVNHHEFASDADSGSKAPQVTYTLVGTSMWMNSDKTRAWGQTSPTYMAKQIAAEHGLRAVLTSTTWVSDYEVQSSETDFTFLNRMSAKYGFRFAVSGGTLYFIDPSSVLSGSSTQGVPTFTMNKSFAWQDTIRKFKKIEGNNLPGSELATRQLSGVDQNTGAPFTVTATGTSGRARTKIQTSYVASSAAEAQVMADAWQSQSQFYIQATAELFGNTLLYPGKLVYLQGTAMMAGSAGLWMVTEADHLLKSSGTSYTVLDKYVTRVTLIRNQDGTAPAISRTSVISPEFTACRISNGQWVSDQVGVYYDGVLS